MTTLADLHMTCPQGEEIARLIRDHDRAEAVALRPVRRPGEPQRLTLFMPEGDLVFMVDVSGRSWPCRDFRVAA